MGDKQSCNMLIIDYKCQKQIENAQRLSFKGVEGYDVYNPSIPFNYNGKTYIVGRVEKRDSEESEAVFFEKKAKNEYEIVKDMKRFRLQDPFIAYIDDKWILGGTETFPHPEDATRLWWRTAFYYGDDLNNLQLLTYGPNGMKDIRLVELQDKRIGVFTRPQGIIGGKGKIGFTIIDKLEDLSPKTIESATLLQQFNDDEWGGVNQAILLDNGHIGVIGHIARFSEDGSRHYYSMAFTLNPSNLSYSPLKIIATRKDFLKGEYKREDLIDVLFSAGIEILEGDVRLYTGVSDVEVQVKSICNPFANSFTK